MQMAGRYGKSGTTELPAQQKWCNSATDLVVKKAGMVPDLPTGYHLTGPSRNFPSGTLITNRAPFPCSPVS